MNDKILFVSPGFFRGDDAPHMRRDAFRYVQHLERHGRSARLLLLSEPGCTLTPRDSRLVAASYEEWTDPAFWESFDVDAVMMYAYGMLSPPRMFPVFRALRKAGLRILFQMDAGLGLPAFPYRCWTMFKRRYWWARAERPACAALVHASIRTAAWAWGGSARFVCRDLLPLCDLIRLESPLSVENTKRRLRAVGRPDVAGRVAFAPHPVPEEFAWRAGSGTKRKRIVCVANKWDNPLKGGRVLGRAFSSVLPGSGWEALVVGGNSSIVRDSSGNAKDLVSTLPLVASTELARCNLESSILATASGAETGPIVVWEALAAGCSVVFPPELAQLEPLVGWNVATMARHRTVRSLARALSAEMKAWDEGLRNPDRIAREVGTHALVSELSEHLLSTMDCQRIREGV